MISDTFQFDCTIWLCRSVPPQSAINLADGLAHPILSNRPSSDIRKPSSFSPHLIMISDIFQSDWVAPCPSSTSDLVVDLGHSILVIALHTTSPTLRACTLYIIKLYTILSIMNLVFPTQHWCLRGWRMNWMLIQNNVSRVCQSIPVPNTMWFIPRGYSPLQV